MIQNKNHSRKKLILLVGLALLVIGGGYWLYQSRQSSPEDNWQDGINYNPPTEQEQSAGDDKKREIVAEEEQQNQQDQPQQQGAKQSVSVAITDANQYGGVVEVRSFVPSYSQDGTCTLKFTQGSRTFTRTTPGYKDVSSTVCPAVEVPVSEFPNSGEWQVVVPFESTNAKGQSDARTFTVD